MSEPAVHNPTEQLIPASTQEPDVVESIALAAPIILPIVGAVLMVLLAFIAVSMACQALGGPPPVADYCGFETSHEKPACCGFFCYLAHLSTTCI